MSSMTAAWGAAADLAGNRDLVHQLAGAGQARPGILKALQG